MLTRAYVRVSRECYAFDSSHTTTRSVNIRLVRTCLPRGCATFTFSFLCVSLRNCVSVMTFDTLRFDPRAIFYKQHRRKQSTRSLRSYDHTVAYGKQICGEFLVVQPYRERASENYSSRFSKIEELRISDRSNNVYLTDQARVHIHIHRNTFASI